MPTSVMPKGVEHVLVSRNEEPAHGMPTSVMPKGVEHTGFLESQRAGAEMPTSVMPKGVEHAASPPPNTSRPSYAHLCDAERR